MRSEPFLYPVDSRRFYLALGCLIAAAWGLLVVWQQSAYGGLLDHDALEGDHYTLLQQLAALPLSWSLMTAAMMLPGSLPMIHQSMQPVWRRMKNTRLAGLIILGYAFPWVLFGLLIFLGDSILHRMFAPPAPLAAFSGFIAPAMALTAGLYQLTPVQQRFLKRCRPRRTQAAEVSEEKIRAGELLKQGLKLGVTCTGSCWALMLLMFALGHNRLIWMLVLGLILAAERLTPWGRHLARLVGLALTATAIAWAIAQAIARALP